MNADGKVEVIANEEGDRLIPTVLSYVDGEEHHGTQAKAQLVRNSKNTIAYFRDFLGKDFKSIDPTPCHASAHPIASDSTVAFSVQDSQSENSNTLTVSEVATRHLRRLKASASDFTGKTITSAVISVPTDSTEIQKKALEEAARDAQIQILQLIHEPVAAVVAYDSKSTDLGRDKMVVVADFGGNRSDVTVVACRGGLYSILATAHDYELGGVQLDQMLVDFFAKEFMKKHKIDPRTDARGLAKLKLESEAVKRSLSQSQSATLSLESLVDGIDFRLTVNRTRFDMLGVKIFQRFSRLVEDAIRKAGLDVLDVDEVIMSGGTSNVPRIASNIQQLFPESTTIFAPSTSPQALNPSELAARGAAIQASLIQEFEKVDIDQSTHEMVTVTPHLHNAIGMQTVSGDEEGVFTPIIPADTPVPARHSITFTAPAADTVLRVCEGEREIVVTKPEQKPTINGTADSETEEGSEGGGDDEDDDEEEEEEQVVRQLKWKPTKPLAVLTIPGLKKDAAVELTVNVGADLGVNVTARVVGKPGGVRGELQPPEVVENGSV